MAEFGFCSPLSGAVLEVTSDELSRMAGKQNAPMFSDSTAFAGLDSSIFRIAGTSDISATET
jgi:hypothetical protein